MKTCAKCGTNGHTVRTCPEQAVASKRRANADDKSNVGWEKVGRRTNTEETAK